MGARAQCPGCGGSILLKLVQPETANGSPEPIIERATASGAQVTGGWVSQIEGAVAGLDSAGAILRALAGAVPDSELPAFAEPIHEELIHCVMLGALDSQHELETGDAIEPPAFEEPEQVAARDPADRGLILLAGRRSFAASNFQTALDYFRAKKPVTRPVYDALDDKARERAFTVAGMARTSMIRTTQRELARQIGAGTDLRQFQRFARERLESAGWTPASPSHVETIARTNGLGAYNAGRAEHMMRPSVLRLRPYWQVLTVNDGPPRQRPTHQALHLRVLRADDPAWAKAYPPFGYNCRCRVRTLPKTWKGSISSGLPGVPDKGFRSSGVPNLIGLGSTTQGPATPPPRDTPRQPRPARPAQPRPPQPRPGTVPAQPVTPQPRPPAPPPVEPPAPPPPPPAPAELEPLKPPAAPLPTEKDFKKAGIKVVSDLELVQSNAQAVLGQPLTPKLVEDVIGVGSKFPGMDVKYTVMTPHPSSGNYLRLSCTVTNKHGTTIADISRRLEVKGGELVAKNAYFVINDTAKGKGVGRTVIADQVKQYRALGVKRIELEAAWDGQYVWPRMGYRLRNPADLDGLKAGFVNWLKSEAGYTIAEGVEVARKATDIHELAIMVDAKGRQLGKEYLRTRGNGTGHLIDLEIPLDDESTDFQRMKKYLGL